MSSTLKYDMTKDEVNLILSLLNEAPYRLAAPLIKSLVDQYQEKSKVTPAHFEPDPPASRLIREDECK